MLRRNELETVQKSRHSPLLPDLKFDDDAFVNDVKNPIVTVISIRLPTKQPSNQQRRERERVGEPERKRVALSSIQLFGEFLDCDYDITGDHRLTLSPPTLR